MVKKFIVLSLLFFTASFFFPLQAISKVEKTIVVDFATENQVVYQKDNGIRFLRKGDVLPPTGIISTKNGRCKLLLPDKSIVKLMENSSLELQSLTLDKEKNTLLGIFRMLKRRVLFTVKSVFNGKRELILKTSTCTVGVRGTQFHTQQNFDNSVNVSSYDGIVNVTSSKEVNIKKGFGAYVDPKGEVLVRNLPAPPEFSPEPLTLKVPFKLTWKAPAGIDKFEVTIARDEELDNVVFNGVIKGQQIQFYTFEEGEYFVMVQSVDDLGFLSIPGKAVKIKVVK